jgi:Spy/CpxP family protein refolding chaperone
MRRHLGRLLLLFSLGLNLAFVTIAVVRARETVTEERGGRPADFSPRWQGRRDAIMGRALRLEPAQRRALHEHSGAVRPELQAARHDLFLARREFREALRRANAPGARLARAQVSQAQIRLDSLSAEAMLAELAVLRPEQRERYLRWTIDRPRFRHDRGRPHEDE